MQDHSLAQCIRLDGKEKRLNEKMEALVKGLHCMADQMVIYLANYLCINSYVFIEI